MIGPLLKQAFYCLYAMYSQGMDTNFGYLKNLKEIFVTSSMDHMFKEEFDMNTMKEGVRHHHCSFFENDINNMLPFSCTGV